MIARDCIKLGKRWLLKEIGSNEISIDEDDIEENVVPQTPAQILQDDNEGCDKIEIVLLNAYNRIFDIPTEMFDDPSVKKNIQALYSIVYTNCRHLLREPVASLYYIRRGLLFREFRLCYSCFCESQNYLRNVIEMHPEYATFGFYSTVGTVFGFYRFVLIF